MAKLECRRCGFRITVPDSDLKFGMDCPECHARKMGVRGEGGPRGTPLGGLGGLPMAVARPLFGAPIVGFMALVLLSCGGIRGLAWGVLFAGYTVYLVYSGFHAWGRHSAEARERKRRDREDGE